MLIRMVPHHFGNPDLDPHQSEKLDHNCKCTVPKIRNKNILRNETARSCFQFLHSVRDLYIFTIYPKTQYRKIGRQIVGIYKYIKRHEYRSWERGRAVSFLGIFVLNFRHRARSGFASQAKSGTGARSASKLQFRSFSGSKWSYAGPWTLTMEAWRSVLCMPMMYQYKENQDPDLHPDPHQSERRIPNTGINVELQN